jgi:TPR repeat protein
MSNINTMETVPSSFAKKIRTYFVLWCVCLIAMMPLSGGIASGLLESIPVIVCSFAVGIGMIVFQYLLLYQGWKSIPVDIARTTPGKAVGFLFIPIFNLYWMFVAYDGLIKDMNAALQRKGEHFRCKTHLGSFYCKLWLLSLPASVCQWVYNPEAIRNLPLWVPVSLFFILVIIIFFGAALASLIGLFVLINFLRNIKTGAIALQGHIIDDADTPVAKSPQASAFPSVNESIMATVAIIGTLCLALLMFFCLNPTVTIDGLRKAAERGDISAQHELATRYITGEGVPEDIPEAVKWLRRLVEVDGPQSVYAPNASYILGLAYYNGEGVQQDKEEGIRWFHKAAERASMYFTQEQIADIKFTLGHAYFNGDGVPENKEEAVKWFRDLAQSMGDTRSQFMLGVSYQTGEGVQEDKAEAVEWYRRAAEKGFAPAQYLLGLCYYNGEGVLEDKAESVKWLRKAAEQGHTDAIDTLRELGIE